MQKLSAFVIFSSLLLPPVYAQNFMGTGSTPASGDAGASSQVMTSEQFKSTVDSLSKQNKTNLSNQVDDQLKAGSTVTPAPSIPTPNTTPVEQPAPTATNPPSFVPEPPSPNTPSGPSTKLQTPPPNSATSPTTTQPSANQPYTGFGGTQPKQNQNSGGTQQGGSSGWNVGY
jgi:hypothetical protein